MESRFSWCMPWQPYFEPAFTEDDGLVAVAQPSLELWDGSLETLTEPIGRLMKVDEYTSSFSRARFAWVRLEIDLAQPLKRGFRIEDGTSRVFVMILYERLPTFCFTYGLVGHGTNSYSRRYENSPENDRMEVSMEDRNHVNSSESSESLKVRQAAALDQSDLARQNEFEGNHDSEFGPLILATRRKNRKRSRSGNGGPTNRGSQVTNAGHDASIPTV